MATTVSPGRVRPVLPTIEAPVQQGPIFVLEGPDGVGKSRQHAIIAANLAAAGIPVRAVREPGDTVIAREIRALLLRPDANLDYRSEVFLFLAARADLWSKTVVPFAAEGGVTLLDRSSLSLLAHQGAGRRYDLQWLANLSSVAQCGAIPSATIVLHASPELRAERMAARGQPKDRMEADADLMSRVVHYYERVSAPAHGTDQVVANDAARVAGPIVRVDGAGTPAEVADRILAVMQPHLAARGWSVAPSASADAPASTPAAAVAL